MIDQSEKDHEDSVEPLRMHQICRFPNDASALTLRVGGKNGKNKPRIVYRVGKEDKLIKDYLEIYGYFKDY